MGTGFKRVKKLATKLFVNLVNDAARRALSSNVANTHAGPMQKAGFKPSPKLSPSPAAILDLSCAVTILF